MALCAVLRTPCNFFFFFAQTEPRVTSMKKTRCGTASGEINLEANKSRKHVHIVSQPSPQTIAFKRVSFFFKVLLSPVIIGAISLCFCCCCLIFFFSNLF